MLFLKKRNTERRPPKTTCKGVLTALFATVAAIFLLLLAGLSLLVTAMALAATMPLFVVFIPVLVPAVITASLLATGLAATGSSGMTALTIFMWLFTQLKDNPKPPISSGHPGITDGKPTPKHAAKPTSKPKDKPTIAASG